MGRDRLLRRLVRERFIVTLRTGETFDGLLDEWDESTVSFVGVAAVGEQRRLPIDGVLYLPRAQIAYMQKPGGSP